MSLPHQDAGGVGVSTWKRCSTALGWIAAAMLLSLAVWFGSQSFDREVLSALSWQAVLSLIGLTLVSYLVSGLLFTSVTRGFAVEPPVSVGKMTALTMASGLLNYVPAARPGLWGRAAYLRAYHGLPIRASVVILMVVMAMAVVVLVGTAGKLLLTWSFEEPVRWASVLVWLVVLSAISIFVVQWTPWRGQGDVWLWPVYRMVDLLATAGRLYIALGVLGVPASFLDVVLMASGSLTMRLVGLTPNGLGLSEWAVSVISAAISPGTQAAAATAALIDRSVEFVVTCVCGLASMFWLKHCAKHRPAQPTIFSDTASSQAA
jgi:uncharacterized membrane protein YbhN (UPF0104 family)